MTAPSSNEMSLDLSGNGSTAYFTLTFNDAEDLTMTLYCGEEVLTWTKQGVGEIASW